MPKSGDFHFQVDASQAGSRLDVFLSTRLLDCSRSFAAELINQEKILVNRSSKKPGYRIRRGDQIQGTVPQTEPLTFQPEPIPIRIVYEDDHLLVVDKPAGLVVHPAPGHFSGTLVNALLYHCPSLGRIGGEPRPGIVHRLDKGTSGLLAVAKNDASQRHLVRQFKRRQVAKEYLALVFGRMASESGVVNLPIGRHPVDRKRMSTLSRKKRDAETLWRVREDLNGITLLELHLKTGRTHQIRVHCAAINHPIVGDPVYRPGKLEKKIRLKGDLQDAVIGLIRQSKRQMLHAAKLQLTHPQTEQFMTFESPLPEDMANLLEKLRKLSKSGS